jgi:hypothetical protein
MLLTCIIFLILRQELIRYGPQLSILKIMIAYMYNAQHRIPPGETMARQVDICYQIYHTKTWQAFLPHVAFTSTHGSNKGNQRCWQTTSPYQSLPVATMRSTLRCITLPRGEPYTLEPIIAGRLDVISDQFCVIPVVWIMMEYIKVTAHRSPGL